VPVKVVTRKSGVKLRDETRSLTVVNGFIPVWYLSARLTALESVPYRTDPGQWWRTPTEPPPHPGANQLAAPGHQGLSLIRAVGWTCDGVGTGLRGWLMSIYRFSSPVGYPSGDLNQGAAHHGLAMSSGGWRGFVDVGMLSPWRLDWKLGPWICWVPPPLHHSRTLSWRKYGTAITQIKAHSRVPADKRSRLHWAIKLAA